MVQNLAVDITHVPVSDLILHPRNPRRGNVDAIAESIRTNGFVAPLVVQRSTMHVLAGNHRLRAACQLGMDTVPVVFVDVDDDRALRVLLADNRTSDLGTNDSTQLAAILQDIAATPDALAGTAYSADDLAKMLIKPCAPEEFAEYSEGIETDHRCPKCGYRWAGSCE